MLRKIITYFLILAVVLPILASAVPLGAGVNRAQAVDETKTNNDGTTTTTTTTTGKDGKTTVTTTTYGKDGTMLKEKVIIYKNGLPTSITNKTSNEGRVKDPCDLWTIAGDGTVMECISNTIMNLFYDYVLQGAIVVAGLAGELFNASIQFSLTGKVFDADKNTMIKDGWTLVRDLLNLVFIFILLFAAISTILQYGNMDIKKILPSLIVAALLVNFSMMIAKMVIDASHIFAWEFYNQIDVTKGKKVANMKNSIEVYGDFEKKNLANVFIAGFNPQDFLTGSDKGDGKKSQWKEALDDSIAKGGTYTSTFWQGTLILLLESVLAIFAGFILLAGAIMFVVRVVVLWLVMIFSPLAFLSMILPSMGKYSKMWWDYLIGQSFFAPAFLFMFMLTTKFINSNFIESIFETSSNSDLKIALGLNGAAITLTFFHFFVVGVLMMACLIVARQLGGKTAEFGISWAHKGKELALGGAKKLAWGPARYGLRYGGGYLADKTLDKKEGWGETRWAKTLSAIPGVGIGLRKLGTMKKADEDKARKAAEKYAGTLSSAGRKSLASDIEGKGFMKRFMYTGLEGALKPGKEGYEKIIAKKNAEKEEEDRVFKKRIELMGGEKEFLDKFADIGSGDSEETVRQKIYNAQQRAKSLIRQGDTAELDKLIEEKDKLEEEKNKTERDGIIVKKRKLNLEIDGYKYSLNEARKSGKGIKLAEDVLLGAQKDLEDYEKEIAEIVAKEKHRENLQKTVDKYDDKQRARAGKPEEKKEKEAKSK